MLAQQQAVRAGTVDEQIASYFAGRVGRDRADVAVFGRIDLRHVRLDVLYAQLLGAVPAKQFGKFSGIQVISVVHDKSVFGRRNLLRGEAIGK